MILKQLFIGFIFSIKCFAQTVQIEDDFVQKIKNEAQKEGVQIGIIADSQESLSKVVFEIVSSNDIKTAYDALQLSTISKMYHPRYNTYPSVVILSLMGINPSKINNTGWAFFTYNSGWKISNKGIAETIVNDGDIIGFSLTSWKIFNDGIYYPEKEPRM